MEKTENRVSEPTILAVGFDFDGTLFDTGEAIVASFADTCLELGVTMPSKEKIVPLIGRSLSDIIVELEFNTMPAETVIDMYRKHHVNHIPKITMFEGALDCLQSLKKQGVRVAIVTTRYSQSVDHILQVNGIDRSFFDCVITGDMCEKLKPHPEPLHRAMKQMEIEPHEFCYVGDRAVDSEAAVAAGVQFVAVGWGDAPFCDVLPTGAHACVHPREFFLLR